MPYTATNLNVTWMSSDPSVIEIDEEGNLYPKKEGSCTIIAKNLGNTIKDELNIKVVNIDYSVDQRCNWSGVNMNSKKGGLRVSLKLYAKNTYTIMKKYKFWRVLYERTNH